MSRVGIDMGHEAGDEKGKIYNGYQEDGQEGFGGALRERKEQVVLHPTTYVYPREGKRGHDGGGAAGMVY